ncbi:hypothetical protein V1260_05980 [Brachybacterium sp. J144]|uniref:hypothetical protein n=1 Tax=Brachybacterium sp. J144 TaxID=3116487 RepID=UPI002E77847F|nr:hypothetical protein [Brachybacterium sp. J144]MEE1650338.1 hypothetical protein [Brachybacterium sp. J144]
MTAHDPALPDHLASLRGQWIEGIAVDADRTRLVTSRGAVLHGPAEPGGASWIGGDGLSKDDGRLLGAVVTATTLAPEGVLTLVLADADGNDPLLVAIRAPWVLALPRGAGLAARADGRIDVREGSGPVHATAEAMGAWTESEPCAVERAVLEAAEDDWVSPGDVVSALLRAGVSTDEEIARQGIAVLSRLLARGDLEAGWIEEEGFRPAEGAPADVIEHVATVWHALAGIGRRPGPGQIAWFRIPESAGGSDSAGDPDGVGVSAGF